MALRQRSRSPSGRDNDYRMTGRGYGHDYPMTHYHPFSMMDQLFNFPDQLTEIPTNWLSQVGQETQLGRTTQFINTDDQFKLNLAVEGFKPEELNVKVVRDRFLVVHGKHQEAKETDVAAGYAAREFTRSFVIPNGVDLSQLKSNFNRGGILSIEAPKTGHRAVHHERPVPIEFSST